MTLSFSGVLSSHTSGDGAAGSVSSQSPRAEEEGAERQSVWDTETVIEVKGDGVRGGCGSTVCSN